MIILAAALLITSPLQSVDPGALPWSDTMTSTDVNECRPAYCEEWQVDDEGTLLCFDTDEEFGPGHWSFDLGPDYGDL
jgi:hypothetical protein